MKPPAPPVFMTLAILVFALTACGNADTRTPTAAEAEWDAFFDPIERLHPVQSEASLIASAADVTADPTGRILVTDPSEGNLKLYEPGSDRAAVIGRHGQGPGEFRRPLFARFVGDSIYVGDTNAVIHVFDRTGSYGRTFRVDQLMLTHGMAVGPDGTLLVTGVAADRGNLNVLFRTDRQGAVVSEHLPAGDVIPTGAAGEARQFTPLRSFYPAVRGDTAFVTSTLSDTLWTVHLASGMVSSERIVAPGVRHADGPPPASSIDEFSAFARSIDHTYKPVAGPTLLLVPFLSTHDDGQRLVRTAVRDATGAWFHITGSIIPAAAIADGILGYSGEGDALVFELARERRQ